jgi:endoglucanase
MKALFGAIGMTIAMSMGIAAAEPGTVYADEWAAYQQAFVEQGRVIDIANGRISHSEGQGYGLLLSYLAGDKDGFAAIWKFTTTQMMVRDDGLLAWKWQPDASPHVTDSNNAADGDILVAYALILAGQDWNRADYVDAGRQLATTLGTASTLRWRGRDILLLAVFGFRQEDQDGGPIINLSYWIFEAFPVLAKAAPNTDWAAIAQNGRLLVHESRFGPLQLPTDWIALGGEHPAPAPGFTPEFGYNSVRIPLYLLRGGSTEPVLLRQFIAPLSGETAATTLVDSGQAIDRLHEPGYRIIGAAISCVLDGTSIDPALLTFTPQSYYGSTLQLLTLSYLRQSAPQCL